MYCQRMSCRESGFSGRGDSLSPVREVRRVKVAGIRESDILSRIGRDQMNVNMGNFPADNHHYDTFAATGHFQLS